MPKASPGENLPQRSIAEALEKSPSEVSKWLSGMHNSTLKSIAKIEVILGAPILVKATAHTLDEQEVLGRIASLKTELENLEKIVAKAS